jgi:DNA-3-methyladenine glycosylase II
MRNERNSSALLKSIYTTSTLKTFDPVSFKKACEKLAEKHASIQKIKDEFGLPEMYSRPFGFDTLVHIILEQQVSLASAKAALTRLQNRLGSITPEGILSLDTEALRTCAVSRQKARYLHHLSEMVISGNLDLESIPHQNNDEVKQHLMQVKGIGIWTAEVVLMLCLQRTDVFPLGDIALMNSVRHIHEKPDWLVDEIGQYAACYAPYRTMAAFCYWHAYIKRKKITFLG